jgi:hypothetical protein
MIKIIDDFFSDPYKIRSEGISCNSFSQSQNYPGKRHLVTDSTKKYIEKKLQIELGFNLEIQEIGFDFITKDYVCGIPHHDKNSDFLYNFCNYSAVIYLNPNPPKNTGIEIYQCSKDCEDLYFHTENADQLKKGFFSSSKNKFDRFIWKNLIIPRTMKGLKDKIEVSNKFNRMIVFDSDLVHRPQNYFGKNKDDCRMSIITFLKKK